MTEDEAWALIALIKEPLRDLNAADDWQALINGAPIELSDEHGEPTGAFYVAVAWYCWTRNSKTAIPLEMGNMLAVTDRVTDIEALYQTLRRGCTAAMGDQRIFRTRQDAKAAVFA